MKLADLTKRPPPINFRTIWALHSTRAAALIGTVQALVALADREQPLPFFPSHTFGEVGAVLTTLLAAYGIIGRFIDQAAPETPPTVSTPTTTQHTMMFADSLPCDATEELHARNSQ